MIELEIASKHDAERLVRLVEKIARHDLGLRESHALPERELSTCVVSPFQPNGQTTHHEKTVLVLEAARSWPAEATLLFDGETLATPKLGRVHHASLQAYVGGRQVDRYVVLVDARF